jgi:hypothetical protein
MSFAQDAIGFYLQLDDQMSPKLKTAASNYEKFVDQIAKLNKQGFGAINKGMAALSDLVDSFAQLPKAAERAYEQATKALSRKMRPLTQRVDLVFTPRAEKNLRRAISSAISDVLSKVALRLGATMPRARAKGFSTQKSLRGEYLDMVQPPDMRGRFQGIPRFAEGGEVTGGKGRGIDDVLALLSKGEIVLPGDIADKLKSIAESASLESMGKLGAAGTVKVLRDVTDVLAEMALEMADVGKSTAKSDRAMKQMRNSAGKFTKTLDGTNKELKEMLDESLAPVKLLTIHEALESLSGAFGSMRGAGEEAFELAGGGRAPVESFMENLNAANLVLGKSRDQLSTLKEELADLSKGFKNVGADQFSQAFRGLVEQGTGEEFAKQNAGIVAQLTQVGIGIEDASKLTYKWRDAYGYTAEDVTTLTENLRKMAMTSAISFDELLASTRANEESFGAFISKAGLSAEQTRTAMETMAASTSALTKHWGDAGGAMSKLMSDALSGNLEAQATLQGLGVSTEELGRQLAEGDISKSMDRMIGSIQSLGAGAPQVAELANVLNFPGTPEQFMRIVKDGDKMSATMRDLQAGMMGNAEAQKSFNQRLEGSESGFKAWTKEVGKFILGMIPSEVLDFFDGFSVQAAFATLMLGKMALGFVSAGTKALFFSKASSGAVDAVSKGGGAMGAVGKGGGGGIGGFIKGIAQGFAAFASPHVAGGVAVVVLAIGGLAVAARIAEPVLAKFFDVVADLGKKAMDVFVQIFTQLKELDPGKIATISAALLLIGPSLSSFGIGLNVFAYSALLAVPGLLALGGLVKLFGGMETDTLGGAIMGMMQAFAFDTDMVKKAVIGISASILFVTQLTALMLGFGLAKSIALLQKANPLDGLLWFFGSSTTDIFVNHAKDIVATVTSLATHFGGISASTVKKVEDAAPVFGAMASFMSDFAKMSAGMAGMTWSALSSRVVDNIIGAFAQEGGPTSGFDLIVEQRDNIVRTVNMLAKEFSGSKVDVKKLAETLPVFEGMAEFLAGYAVMNDLMKDIQPSALDRVAEFYLKFYGIDSPLQAMRTQVNTIIGTVKDIANGFYLLNKDVTQDTVTGATAGIARAMDLLKAFAPILETTKVVADLADSLQQGFWGQLWGFITQTDSPLVALKKVFTHENGLIATVSEIATFIAGRSGYITGASQWDGLSYYIDVAVMQIGKMGALVNGFDSLGASFVAINSSAATAHAAAVSATPWVQNIIGMASSWATMLAKSDLSDETLNAAVARAMKFQQIALAIRDMAAAGLTAPAMSIQAEYNTPLPTKVDVEKVVRVELDPNTTDRPVLSASMETNILLNRLIDVVSTGGMGPRQPADRASPRAVDPRTKNLSEGGD